VGDETQMQIVYSKKAIKTINGMNKVEKRRIKEAIEILPKGDTNLTRCASKPSA